MDAKKKNNFKKCFNIKNLHKSIIFKKSQHEFLLNSDENDFNTNLLVSKSIYDIDTFSADDLRGSLKRAKENPIEPFKFLTNIDGTYDSVNLNDTQMSKSTDIDIRLASLSKRIQLNKSLLKKTSQRMKDINFITEKNNSITSRNLNNNFSKIDDKNSDENSLIIKDDSRIDEMQRVLKNTIGVLSRMKEIVSKESVSEQLN
ncbi:uncharacterized protein [Chelonus insularis]|uniref:uncharacterized protein n=1 Tax=Chelonus insularis TaxID=460826 RepID=UPI00158C29DB|nr:uncharacterized protein LOC118065475 [Chelonus insularis]